MDSSNFDPILLVQENVTSFVYHYIPRDYPSFIRCLIRRDKSGIQQGFLPTFYLHIERPHDGKKVVIIIKENKLFEFLFFF